MVKKELEREQIKRKDTAENLGLELQKESEGGRKKRSIESILGENKDVSE